MQWDSVLTLAYSPFLHSLVTVIEMPVSAFAVLPGDFEGEGTLDQLVLSVESGLLALEYDSNFSPPQVSSSAIAAGSSLANAFALVCTDFDADGELDIAGIDESRTSVVTLLADGSGSFDWVATFALAGEALDLQALDWDGLPGQEIAVATRWGPQVFAYDGQLHWQDSVPDPGTGPDPNVVMSVVPAPLGSSAADSLVVIEWNGSGTDQLLVLHDNQGRETPVPLSNPNLDLIVFEDGQVFGAVGLSAGDRDGDGDYDLALSHHESQRVKILVNRSGEVPPSAATFVARPQHVSDIDIGSVAGPYLENTSPPCLADLNDDGVAELVIGNGTSANLVVAPEDAQTYDSGCPSPYFESGSILDPTPNWSSGFPDLDGNIGVELVLINGWLPNPKYPTSTQLSQIGITHVEVLVWKQPLGNVTSVLPDPILHYLFAIPPSFDLEGETMAIGFPTDVEPANYGTEGETKYYVEVRPVAYGSGKIFNALSTQCMGLTLTDTPGTAIAELMMNSGAAQCILSSLDSRYVGGFVSQVRVPHLPPNVLPQIGLPTEHMGQ